MAVYEIKDGVSGNFAHDKWTATRAWVVTDCDDIIAAAQAPGVGYGDAHPNNSTDGYMYAVDCDAEPLGDSKYQVTITYESFSSESQNFSSPPWQQPYSGSSSTSLEEVYLPIDFDGKPFVLSNRKPLDGAPPVRIPIHSRTVQFANQGAAGSWTYAMYVGAVNGAVWHGAAAGSVLCAGLASSQKSWKGWAYEELSIEYRFKPSQIPGTNVPPQLSTWQAYLLDAGDCRLIPDEAGRATWEYIGEDESDANTTLRLLDGAGGFLDKSQVAQGVFHWTPMSPHKVYREMSFSALPYA